MAEAQRPPLSDYEQTMALFLEFLQELRNWRKVVDLQHDGVTVFRCTFTFAQLMQPSIDMDIVRVDSFDELPDRSVQPGAAALALSPFAPNAAAAASSGGGWTETAFSAPYGGADVADMAAFSNRDDQGDSIRFPSCGPVFPPHRPWPSVPPSLPRSVNYRALAEDLDVFAKGPVESTVPDRADIRAASAAVNAVDDMLATGTGDRFPNRDDLLRLRRLSGLPTPRLIGNLSEDAVTGPIEPQTPQNTNSKNAVAVDSPKGQPKDDVVKRNDSPPEPIASVEKASGTTGGAASPGPYLGIGPAVNGTPLGGGDEPPPLPPPQPTFLGSLRQDYNDRVNQNLAGLKNDIAQQEQIADQVGVYSNHSDPYGPFGPVVRTTEVLGHVAGYLAAPITSVADTIIGRPFAAVANDLRAIGGKEPLDPGELKRQVGDVASLFALSGLVGPSVRGISSAAPDTGAAGATEGAATQAANSLGKIRASKIGAPTGYAPTAKQAEVLQGLLKQRTDLLSQVSQLNAEADATVVAGDVDAAKALADQANKLKYGSANRVTEQIGETGARNAVEAAFPDAGEPIYAGSGKNTLDLIYDVNNRLAVVEAKGGVSQLGYRQLESGDVAQQGTQEYLQGTVNVMKASSDPATQKMGYELEVALAEGRVDYYLARTAIGTDVGGGNIVKTTTLQQFNLAL
jgi:hypothetical protein